MKKVKFISIVVCLLVVFLLVNITYATMILLGQGSSTHGMHNLIYDTDLDITWYDYSFKPKPWQTQVNATSSGWLSIDFGGTIYDDWRLPTALNQDDSGPCYGYNCTDSEMGHLYYSELGNTAGAGGFTNMGDFQNVQLSAYWSSTEYNAVYAWLFYFSSGTQSGNQYYTSKGSPLYALAVRDGMAVVPEPSTMLLLGSGLFGLGAFRNKFKKN